MKSCWLLSVLMVLLGWAAFPLGGHAAMIQGEQVTVEAIEGQNGKVRLRMTLSDPASGMDASLELGFGTGVPTDLSVVSFEDPPVEDNRLRLRAERSDAGVSEVMEVEIRDNDVVQVSFPDLAPQRPDIAFVFNLTELRYTKARSGSKEVVAVDDAAGKYLQALAEAGYWIFYGSDEFPPLIVTGFSRNRITYFHSAEGTIRSNFNSNETVALSFLSIPDREAWSDEGTLREAGEAFLFQNAN